MSGRADRSDAVLCISSQVAGGPVGNSAVVPAIERLGLTTYSVPTVILSNHPGHGAPAGQRIENETLAAMLARLSALDWLDHCAAVLTGYFAEAGQVRVAADVVRQMKARNGDVIYLCDPVIGDDHTGIYVAKDIACAIRDELLPLADVIAPNRFELAWLSGREVDDPRAAPEAARALPAELTLATSLPDEAGGVMTALVEPDDVCSVTTSKRDLVPHGTGDLLAGLFLADFIAHGNGTEALRHAVAQLEAVLDASAGSDRLDLVRGLENVRDVEPLPLDAA